MSRAIPVVTIDGASGTGKGTISRMLAQELKWHFLDSGALYRVLAYAARSHGVNIEEESSLEALASSLDVQFLTDSNSLVTQIIFESNDITAAIREEEIGNLASVISAHHAVRVALVGLQHDFLKSPGLVADGRDMGRVIFPEAQVKVFLEASAEIRATRRYKQLQERGDNVKFETLLDDLNRRDLRDINRVASPLKAADDAIHVDTDEMTVSDVFSSVVRHVKARLKSSDK
jgi:cytidylate kinase